MCLSAWIARGLLALVLFLNLFIVWILKLANDWNARFFNALEEKNVDAFWVELRYFIVIATLFILIAVYRLWFRQMLQIRRRRWLTEIYYGEWLRDRTYYRMELIRLRDLHADELSLPTASWFKNGERPAEGQIDVSAEFSKRILENLGISLDRTSAAWET